MAKKHLEPFNPWPGFVDLFASVIMVVLMFMLVLIVNISYYAQFKYKISYSGSVSVQEIPSELIISTQENIQDKKEDADIEDIEKQIDTSKKDLDALAGMDLTITDSNLTRQSINTYDDWMLIKYNKKEVILDPKTIKDVEKFIEEVKIRFPYHYISIYIAESKNLISASISKQLALSRALNIRNLIRAKNYKEDDVVIRFKEDIPELQTISHEAGYGIIIVNVKK